MSFALYLDEHVNPLLAALLQSLGHDVLTTHEAGNDGANDEAQMTFAAENGRAILTYDIKDYPRMATEWSLAGRHHFGVIIARRSSAQDLRQRVLALFELYPLGIENICLGLPPPA